MSSPTYRIGVFGFDEGESGISLRNIFFSDFLQEPRLRFSSQNWGHFFKRSVELISIPNTTSVAFSVDVQLRYETVDDLVHAMQKYLSVRISRYEEEIFAMKKDINLSQNAQMREIFYKSYVPIPAHAGDPIEWFFAPFFWFTLEDVESVQRKTCAKLEKAIQMFVFFDENRRMMKDKSYGSLESLFSELEQVLFCTESSFFLLMVDRVTIRGPFQKLPLGMTLVLSTANNVCLRKVDKVLNATESINLQHLEEDLVFFVAKGKEIL